MVQNQFVQNDNLISGKKILKASTGRFRNSDPKKIHIINLQTLRMSVIPIELFREILARVHVEDLFRFRCVSKSWMTMIDDPAFIDLQFAQRNPDLPSDDVMLTICN